MEEREICCCGARRWSLIIGWLQLIVFILAFGSLGLDVLKMIEPEKDIHVEPKPSRMKWVILVMLHTIMPVVLIHGCNNKNPKQLDIWIMYAKISLFVLVVVAFVILFVTPAENVLWSIFYLGFVLTTHVFCIWVVGIHKSEIEASPGTVDDNK